MKKTFLVLLGLSLLGTTTSQSIVQAAVQTGDDLAGPAQIQELTDEQVRALKTHPEETLRLPVPQEIKSAPAATPESFFGHEIITNSAVWTLPVPVNRNPCPTPLPAPTRAAPVIPIINDPLSAPGIVPTPTPTADPGTPPAVNCPPTTSPGGPGGPSFPSDGSVLGNIDAGLVIIDKIVNIGKTVWDVIKEGRAVTNIDTQLASALPSGVMSPMELGGWAPPKAKNFRIIIPNTRGDRKTEFIFRVSFWYGGSFKGKGQFLANVGVAPSDYKVNWGQTFNVRVRVPVEGIVNVSRDEGNPTAAALIYVDWSRSKVFSTNGSSAVIYVRGDGLIQNISADDQPEDVYPIGRGSSHQPRR